MTKEEKMEYIARHYRLMTARELADRLGMSRWMVYDYIKQSGLRLQRAASERKKKQDNSQNPEGEIPKDDGSRTQKVRVNSYTYIMIRPSDDAEERKCRFQRLTGLYE